MHIGALTRARRLEFGADIEEAARWCKMSPEELALLEERADLGAHDFERICRGLAVEPAALLAGTRSPARSPARFRSAMPDPRTIAPRDLRVMALAAEVGRFVAQLLLLLGREIAIAKHHHVKAISRQVEPWEDGYELGEAARAALGPSDGPIAELEASLNSFGVHVASIRFSDPAIEAASVWEPGATPVILLNKGAGRVSYAFSRRAILAHELCHLLHDSGEGQIVTRVSCQDGRGNHAEAIEQRARGFAPAYLAPRQWLVEWRRSLGEEPDPARIVVELATHWGLSIEGAIWHAKNAKPLSPEAATDLTRRELNVVLPADRFEQHSTRFPPALMNAELPDNASPIVEGYATATVIDAFEAGLISLGRARELLSY